MNHKLLLWASFSLVMASSQAQVASHTPTIFKQAPAQRPAASAPLNAGKPVARVNGSVLTDTDLMREEYAIFPYARQHNGIPKDLAPQIRDGALKMIIFEELVYQEAQHRGMSVSALKFQNAKQDFRKQFSTPDQFNAFVHSEFRGSEQLLDEKIRRSLLIDALLQSEVEKKCIVSPAELRSYYLQNPSRFETPETFTFQSISILPPEKATAVQPAADRTRADNALKQAKATKSAEEFGLLAEKISDDDYRVVMGQHKPVPANALPPQVVKTLAALKPGEVSDIIQVDQAYTIVRLQEHKAAAKQTLDQAKAQLQKELQEKKRNDLRSAFDKKLRQTAKIEEM